MKKLTLAIAVALSVGCATQPQITDQELKMTGQKAYATDEVTAEVFARIEATVPLEQAGNDNVVIQLQEDYVAIDRTAIHTGLVNKGYRVGTSSDDRADILRVHRQHTGPLFDSSLGGSEPYDQPQIYLKEKATDAQKGQLYLTPLFKPWGGRPPAEPLPGSAMVLDDVKLRYFPTWHSAGGLLTVIGDDRSTPARFQHLLKPMLEAMKEPLKDKMSVMNREQYLKEMRGRLDEIDIRNQAYISIEKEIGTANCYKLVARSGGNFSGRGLDLSADTHLGCTTARLEDEAVARARETAEDWASTLAPSSGNVVELRLTFNRFNGDCFDFEGFGTYSSCQNASPESPGLAVFRLDGDEHPINDLVRDLKQCGFVGRQGPSIRAGAGVIEAAVGAFRVYCKS